MAHWTLSPLFTLILWSTQAFEPASGAKVAEHRRTNYGIIGYGIHMYEPLCAFACRAVLSGCPLTCSKEIPRDEARALTQQHGGSHDVETSLDCYATNDAFLLSMRLCLEHHCNSTSSWQLNRFWGRDVVGDQDPQPPPVLSFLDAEEELKLSSAAHIPYATMGHELNAVHQVTDKDWALAQASLEADVWVERQHNRSAIILILGTLAMPFLASLGRSLSIRKSWNCRFISSLEYAALWGRRHSVPLPYGIGILPTRGQALFIAYLIFLNGALCCAGYWLLEPNIHGVSAKHRLTSYIANRTGTLSFANMFLMVLCAGRNNLILLVSKWPYSTMLLYHRWIAYICILQALIHAVIYLVQHLDVLGVKFTEAYWNWGVAVITTMVIISFTSILRVRRAMYELFLDSHIALSALVLLSGYYHIFMKFRHEWGYENWVLLAASIWIIERILRVAKILGNGIKTAEITHIDADYMKIHIAGVRAAGHAYASIFHEFPEK